MRKGGGKSRKGESKKGLNENNLNRKGIAQIFLNDGGSAYHM